MSQRTYLKYKQRYYLRRIFTVVLITIVTFFTLKLLFKEEDKKVYSFTELLITYKNCVIVGKTEVHDIPKLYLMNPLLHKDNSNRNMIDYTICVTREVYLNCFIGDIIGKTKFTFCR